MRKAMYFLATVVRDIREGIHPSFSLHRSRTLSLMIICIAVIALVACSSNTSSSTPKQTITPSPASSGTIYPLTVIDLLGRSVQVEQKPSRIVTISPTATEMLYQVGGQAVGRDSSSKYPLDVQTLPAVGSAYSPSIEAIIALNPDLVLIEALNQARFLQSLEMLEVPIIAVRAASLDDIVQGLTLVGNVVDRSEDATLAIDQIESRVEVAQSKSTGGDKILILISDAARNIYAAKPDSYPGAVAELLGLDNLAAGLPDSGPYPGFALFTGEQALANSPDVIFTISPAPEPAPRLSAMLSLIPGYNRLEAVTSGKVKELDPVLFLQAQGPRISDAVEILLDLLTEVSA
jgi:iron complex transport system substrate-binding protein